jgi:hypothetical protein
MRPRGEIRTALAQQLPELVAHRGPVSSRTVAALLHVEPCVARWVLRNMASAGEVAAVGAEKPVGSGRWHPLYEPARPVVHSGRWAGLERLNDAMRRFAHPPASPEPA